MPETALDGFPLEILKKMGMAKTTAPPITAINRGSNDAELTLRNATTLLGLLIPANQKYLLVHSRYWCTIIMVI